MTGRGRGFGMGRGKFSVNASEAGGSNGFGGFGLTKPPTNDDDVWDESSAAVNGSGGHETNNGGFTSNNVGFGDANSSQTPFGSGDGFGHKTGSNYSGNRTCYKCNKEGHMSRDCPQGGGGGGGNRACFKCGQEGHISRDCPQGGGGGGGNRACFKCGQEGHMSRECPNGGGGNRACFKCNEEGHISRDCPKAGGKFGREGHMSREFTQSNNAGGSTFEGSSGGFGNSGGGGFGATSSTTFDSTSAGAGSSGGGSSGGFGGSSGGFSGSASGFGSSSGFGGSASGFGDGSSGGFGDSTTTGGDHRSTSGFNSGGGSSGCRNCGQDGHFARECPEPKKGGDGCRNCGESGHFARECPNPRKPQGACRTCNTEGHFSKDCPQNEGKPQSENYVPPEDTENEETMFSSIQVGINFDKYDNIPVELTGNNPTKPIFNFSDTGLSETIESNVRKAKYFKPTPIQKYAIPAIMAGRDLMGCAQTGSGKTAAFLLPALHGLIQKGLESSQYSPIQEPQALVIAPTRELVIQIYNECRKFSFGTIVRCVRLYGGTSTMHQLNDLSKGAHIIIATPGRLLDFINRQKIGLGKIQYLILDEADRMLDMGFEPDVRRLVETMGMPEKTSRQTLMFSATFPVEIQKLASEFLNDYLFLTVGVVGGANTDVAQTIIEVERYEKNDKLLEILREHPNQRTLVFVEQKRNADFLASMLSQSEFATTSIHGDRLQREREQALRDFKSGVAPVLVATSVAARGLDIPGVDHVINFDLPKDIDEYVHRIGRTGRCGNLGKATSFFDADNNADVARHLVRCLAAAHQTVPDFLDKAADRGYSGGGGDNFGGRDNRARRGGGDRGGGDRGGWDEQGSGMVAPAAISTAAADDDESWD